MRKMLLCSLIFFISSIANANIYCPAKIVCTSNQSASCSPAGSNSSNWEMDSSDSDDPLLPGTYTHLNDARINSYGNQRGGCDYVKANKQGSNVYVVAVKTKFVVKADMGASSKWLPQFSLCYSFTGDLHWQDCPFSYLG